MSTWWWATYSPSILTKTAPAGWQCTVWVFCLLVCSWTTDKRTSLAPVSAMRSEVKVRNLNNSRRRLHKYKMLDVETGKWPESDLKTGAQTEDNICHSSSLSSSLPVERFFQGPTFPKVHYSVPEFAATDAAPASCPVTVQRRSLRHVKQPHVFSDRSTGGAHLPQQRDDCRFIVPFVARVTIFIIKNTFIYTWFTLVMLLTSINMFPWSSDRACLGRPLRKWSPSQFCETTYFTCVDKLVWAVCK